MLGFKKSPWVIHYDASSCNGCDIETLACLTPVYDVERLGIINTGNPKHADIFVVTGSVNEQNKSVVRNIYQQLPEPKVVVAVGVCASTGGIFRDCYNISGGVDTVIPVDIYVPGCAARPEAIIDGIAKAMGLLEERQKVIASLASSMDKPLISQADKKDVYEILALQKVAYQSESELYSDVSLPALEQSLTEIEQDFEKKTFLKAQVNGKIIASVRGYQQENTAFISRLTVHPYFQGKGLGIKMVEEMEQAFPQVKRFEVFTGDKSKRNLHLYGKLGYLPFKTEPFSKTFQWVYMQKEKK